MTVAVPQARFADTLIYILSHRATHVATLVWVLANAAGFCRKLFGYRWSVIDL